MDIITQLVKILNLPVENIENTVSLLQDNNTIPFIARYRKEITCGLDEEMIQRIQSDFSRLTHLEERRQTIIKSINSQGKLTDSLLEQILATTNLTELEDLYLPYRPKKRTRAMIAREKGLETLSDLIIAQTVIDKSIQDFVEPYINNDVPDHQSAISGACDIIAERISDNATIRQSVRVKGLTFGTISSEGVVDTDDKRKTYALYYQFNQRAKLIQPHQTLALNRGEREKILKVAVTIHERDWLPAIKSVYPPNIRSIFYDVLNIAIADGAHRLLLPAIERDIRRSLTEFAEEHAIRIFAKNLYGLLTQPPLADHVVLGIDPGFRTGSKVAVVDPTGKLLTTTTIYPHPPQNRAPEASMMLKNLIDTYRVTLIVIGNGTASRETETFIAELIKRYPGLHYLITSEAGASVYSASKQARMEFPDLDVSLRGAVSIARRVQDPLAELVKIDPKSIGVGLYQHDVNQARLSQALDQVVESVVNAVGVEVNTASVALLSYVAGIGPVLAERIISYRDEHGPFQDRSALHAVPGMGPKSFEQSAGFLRIRNGENPLDATAIHPESYVVAEKVLQKIKQACVYDPENWQKTIQKFKETEDLEQLANELNTGLPTLLDILDELARPGRDPREDIPKPILRNDVLSISDLSQGMQLTGTIRNIVDFGAFVDLGVNIDGLLHRSKIQQGTNLAVGDIIEVKIISIDLERDRIGLEMKE
ncbi:MAG: Tex family protein [Anaerolineaceae bacterium]